MKIMFVRKRIADQNLLLCVEVFFNPSSFAIILNLCLVLTPLPFEIICFQLLLTFLLKRE